MKINMKKLIVLLLITAAFSLPVFAQRTGSASGSSGNSAPSKPVLTVVSNVRNAAVEISTLYIKNGPIASGTAPFSAQLDPGTYVITVTAPGYEPGQQTITLNSNQTVTINLGQTQQPALGINSNIRGALVQISHSDNNSAVVATGSAPFTVQLDPGSYVVTVSAPGYSTEQQSLNFRNNMTLNFNLKREAPVQFSLSINSNVRDAKVIIKGSGLNGQLVGSAPFTAQLNQGNYTIDVSADGYKSASREVSLASSQNVTINLEQNSYNLTITSNVEGAKVFIKGGSINGQLTGSTDMTTVLAPGSYQVKVNAPGYFAEEQTIYLSESTTLNIQLKGRTGRLDIIIPNEILDYSGANPAAQIKIFDNGKKVNDTSMELTPGQHTIRITSGAFASQQTINVQAGDSYRIVLDFGFELIKE